jgi:phage shock protein E
MGFIDFIKRIFRKEQVNYTSLIDDGAIVIDVRAVAEFESGHYKNAINIPLDTLERKLTKLKKDKNYITCCASGMRSGSAKSLLEKYGFTSVINAGNWHNLKI